MDRRTVDDLLAFFAVARARSFTRAAAQLGVSQSALSHTVRALETRLGLRLLNRTTRSVAPTQAGERLLRTVAPRLDEIDSELSALTELRDKPSGTIRITAGEHAADTVLWPRLQKFLAKHPDIKLEIVTENRLTDIVAEGFDAGVREGEQVAKDMIAVRIGPDMRMAVVGSPAISRNTPSRRLRRIWHSTIASICACPRAAGSMPGNSRRRTASRMCAWRASLSSTTRG